MGRTRRGARLARLAALALAVAMLATGCSSEGVKQPSTPTHDSTGHTWLSGVWLGGATSTREVRAFGRWRGSKVDTLTTYPAYESWQELSRSDWHVSTFNGFRGRLSYGLPLLPKEDGGSLRDVASGERDDVWRSVARTLVRHDRGDSFVRVGLEANGTWFPWGATAEAADDFKAAYRQVVRVMSSIAPNLVFVFDISCGVALEGAEDDRLASLTRLYPGNDVVDVVGCDHYDSWSAMARDEGEWEDSISPSSGPGLTDVVEFARENGKRFAVPEWGLSSKDAHGAGDNEFFIHKMYEFFRANRDVLAFENYFDEPDQYLGSSLFLKKQNPDSAEVYRELW